MDGIEAVNFHEWRRYDILIRRSNTQFGGGYLEIVVPSKDTLPIRSSLNILNEYFLTMKAILIGEAIAGYISLHFKGLKCKINV